MVAHGVTHDHTSLKGKVLKVLQAGCTGLRGARLPQPGMLGLGPDGHLGSARRDEHERRERPGGRRKQDPDVDLKGVVGAGDVVKAKAARDGIALAAWWPEVPLNDVRPAWAAQGS